MESGATRDATSEKHHRRNDGKIFRPQAEIEEHKACHKAKQRRMTERNQRREAKQTASESAQTRSHWATKYARDQVAHNKTKLQMDRSEARKGLDD